MDVDENLGCNALDLDVIKNRFYYFEKAINLQEISNEMIDHVTRMRCDVSLPESKIQSFVEGCTAGLEYCQQYTITVLKKFCLRSNLQFNDPSVVYFYFHPNIYRLYKGNFESTCFFDRTRR